MAVKVKGLKSRPGYPDTVLRISGRLSPDDGSPVAPRRWPEIRSGETGVHVVLHREPTNPVDPNAIQVCVEEQWVGYLPSVDAARWAPLMDDGGYGEGRVMAVPVHPDHLGRPGLEIEVMFHDPECVLSLREDIWCTCDAVPAGEYQPAML